MAVPELPYELWFKIISIVISSCIHKVMMSPDNDPYAKRELLIKWGLRDLTWEKNAFCTLRLVSGLFDVITMEVAKRALHPRDSDDLIEFDPTQGEGGRRGAWKCEMKSGDIGDDDIRRIYHLFKAMKSYKMDPCLVRTTLLAPYLQYREGISFRVSMFGWEGFPKIMGTEKQFWLFVSQYHDVVYDISGRVVLPEAQELVRTSLQKERVICRTGFDISRRMYQLCERPELSGVSPVIPSAFDSYLDETYNLLKRNSETYAKVWKELETFAPPPLLELPQVKRAADLIMEKNLHSGLVSLVTSWV
ncbi:hypothetical protein AMATHDRAFT_8747 [Amanita thiersii Skay4041]|uniref:Uncharacterized protein n=1 Tax=Amanita thiersii Skay4041 TaxID=703135 RepID=A0A2A9N6K3_9AGAR|nr:hypothetical protein AMATHDRAFT_8747 [Amanita thiersii Skay4041]